MPVLGKNDAFIVPTLDGSATLFSRAFQATYHSVNGAVSESRHVFLRHGLQSCIAFPALSVLEIGFGTGLNAFLAFLFSQKNSKTVSYHGIEAYSLDPALVRMLNYPEYLAAIDKEEIFLQMHTLQSFTRDQFEFRLYNTLPDLPTGTSFNCIFFDAFSPKEQPALWQQDIFDQIAAMTQPGGILVTYCAQGNVRRCLERAGFNVDRLPGAPGKRQMIRASRI